MLENKRLIWVFRLQSLHQVLEVVDVGLVLLAAVIKELHLLTAMSTNADRACEVLLEVLLPPLKGKQLNENDYLYSFPLLGIGIVLCYRGTHSDLVNDKESLLLVLQDLKIFLNEGNSLQDFDRF